MGTNFFVISKSTESSIGFISVIVCWTTLSIARNTGRLTNTIIIRSVPASGNKGNPTTSMNFTRNLISGKLDFTLSPKRKLKFNYPDINYQCRQYYQCGYIQNSLFVLSQAKGHIHKTIIIANSDNAIMVVIRMMICFIVGIFIVLFSVLTIEIEFTQLCFKPWVNER